MNWPSPKMRVALWVWALVWTVFLPVMLGYLVWRSRHDRLYRGHMAERFGFYRPRLPASVWVHAVSLGEVRSAVPLIRRLLETDPVVITCFTPAGRREACAVFAPDIAAGRVAVVWVPFEYRWSFRLFFLAFRPRFGLVMEIEIWPRMIAACRTCGVPLLMCNAQYPSESFKRDTERTTLRADLMAGFHGALVKSDIQRDRFAVVGLHNVEVTGELRFDQHVPARLVDAGHAMRAHLGAGDRPTVTIASAVEGEETLYLDTIAQALSAAPSAPRPFFVIVPRAPERFDAVAQALAARGLSFATRSATFGPDLAPLEAGTPDILLGDSTGEMYAYLAMADRVVVGGGFTPKGAHNVSEPLALGKPVIVGPQIWTIEYPATEAIAAGVVVHLPDAESLPAALTMPLADSDRIAAFFATHAGAVDKTLDAIPRLLATSR